MSAKTLSEIELSIGQLDLPDQVRLLEYLAPRIAGAVLAGKPPATPQGAAEAVNRFFAVGDRLAATSIPGAPSLTQAVSELRR